jgi:hypothetical protein
MDFKKGEDGKRVEEVVLPPPEHSLPIGALESQAVFIQRLHFLRR